MLIIASNPFMYCLRICPTAVTYGPPAEFTALQGRWSGQPDAFAGHPANHQSRCISVLVQPLGNPPVNRDDRTVDRDRARRGEEEHQVGDLGWLDQAQRQARRGAGLSLVAVEPVLLLELVQPTLPASGPGAARDRPR